MNIDTLLFDAFGDPREHPRFNPELLQSGDYAMIMSARPGAIYFLRTRGSHGVGRPLDCRVIMAHLLLGRNADHGEPILRSLTKGYELQPRERPEMDDGTILSYFSLLKK